MADGEALLDSVDYALPPERIAQTPAERREDARLLIAARSGPPGEAPIDAHVRDLPEQLAPGDLLVVNTTRVLPARLRGRKSSGGAAEALLLGPADAPPGDDTDGAVQHFRALLRTNHRQRPGLGLCFEGADGRKLEASIVRVETGGDVVLRFEAGTSPYELGEAPLPPYIERAANDARRSIDRERYQTVFAQVPGAVAAPTAGLHLSQELLGRLDARGVERAEVVLHVGIGTFRPPRSEDLAAGRLHAERYALPEAAADAIARTRARGGRVVAVGTTTARVLESRARDDGSVEPGEGETDLFLRPGSRFRAVDALLTNFHLPRSSLLLLVAAFAGTERVLGWYRHAVRGGYRFYSYGDAMLIR